MSCSDKKAPPTRCADLRADLSGFVFVTFPGFDRDAAILLAKQRRAILIVASAEEYEVQARLQERAQQLTAGILRELQPKKQGAINDLIDPQPWSKRAKHSRRF